MRVCVLCVGNIVITQSVNHTAAQRYCAVLALYFSFHYTDYENINKFLALQPLGITFCSLFRSTRKSSSIYSGRVRVSVRTRARVCVSVSPRKKSREWDMFWSRSIHHIRE